MADPHHDHPAGGSDPGLDAGDWRDEPGHGGNGDGAGLGPPAGLSPFDRSVIDRAAREGAIEEGRVAFGRYAAAHPGDLQARSGGGLSEGDAAAAVVDAAQRFEYGDDPPDIAERTALVQLVREARYQTLHPDRADPNIATFIATIPNGAIKTNRDNDWLITLQVKWDNRGEVMRLVDTIPMQVLVTFERVDDAEEKATD